MTTPSLSTSDVSQRLGFTISAEFISNTLGVDSGAEPFLGKPRWTEDNYDDICEALEQHIERCGAIRTPAAVVPVKPGRKPGKKSITAAAKAPAMNYDDEEL